MIKIYVMIFVIGLLGVMGYGAKYYYDTTQATIATLRENNAQLEVAVQTSEESIRVLQEDMAKFQELNQQLQQDLQAAEQYGDELQSKLNRLDLVQDALRDAKKLEGRMNGATANLWRDIIEDTGGDGSSPLPQWLQLDPERTGDQGGDQSGAGVSPASGETETSTAE